MTAGDGKAGSAPLPAFTMSPDVPDGARLWLVRHGETQWSREGRHTGRTDIPLTENGERQARELGRVVAGVRPALVLCSPRTRARETARLAGLDVNDIDDDLAEWDYGDYEGRTTAEIRRDDPDWLLWTDGCPGGEQPADVGTRADRVLRRCEQALAAGPVVLVAHGHICRVIAARWIGLEPAGGGRLLLGTAAPSILSAQYDVPVIDRWNLPTDSDW